MRQEYGFGLQPALFVQIDPVGSVQLANVRRRACGACRHRGVCLMLTGARSGDVVGGVLPCLTGA